MQNNTNSNIISATTTDVLPSNFILTSVFLKIGNGNNIELLNNDYTLIGNTLTIPSGSTFPVSVPANGTTLITVNGYFI